MIKFDICASLNEEYNEIKISTSVGFNIRTVHY
jgi:hypothetical protein